MSIKLAGKDNLSIYEELLKMQKIYMDVGAKSRDSGFRFSILIWIHFFVSPGKEIFISMYDFFFNRRVFMYIHVYRGKVELEAANPSSSIRGLHE